MVCPRGTGDTAGSRFPAALPQTSSFGWRLETGAALSSWIRVPSPTRHLPLRFLPRRREQSCLLCCFRPRPRPHRLHLPLQHLKGQEKHRFSMRPKPIRCGSCPRLVAGATFWNSSWNLAALGVVGVWTCPRHRHRGDVPSISQNDTAPLPPQYGMRF